MFYLVLQFSPWNDSALDDLVCLEDRLALVLGPGAIDGHDFGSNEANIFLLVDAPEATVTNCVPSISEAGLLWKFSAGYRPLHEDAFRRLWPPGDASPFTVA